jgi:arylsulfatase A-like enzyme/Tfp pilus assembly protein PilF
MGIKLTKKQRRYLRDNFQQKSDVQLAKHLGVKESYIRKALQQLKLERTEEDLKKLQKSEVSQRKKIEKCAALKVHFSGKTLVILSIIIAVLISVFVFYHFLGKYFFPKESQHIATLHKQLAPLKASELNILFFTLDTTRADHLGCYGYDKIETPNIDRLAQNGIMFKNATSQAPLTLPSHSSIFTGTYPLYHGVRDNGGFYLEPDKTTLAEILKENGWATSAFIGAFVLDSRWGLDQGFDYYYDNFDLAKYKTISLDSVQREGGEVIAPFFKWLDKNYQKKFFSWIHLYDAHTPYDPPEPYKTRYANGIWGLYDGEIAYVDFLIGKVLNNLKEKKIAEKTIIVIVADHGESLGQHRESGHGFFVYDATTLVPLIIQLPSPKLQGKVISDQVEAIDIMPTLLQILDLSVPQNIQGKSLVSLIMGDNTEKELYAYSESLYPRYHYGWSELHSLRNSKYKYIKAPKPELYDISADPRETTNIYNNNPSIAKKFEQKLNDLMGKSSAQGIKEAGPRKLDEETMQKLMALGYIGGFTSSSKLKKGERLADPKDKIELFNKIKLAEWKSADEQLDAALEQITQVIEQDPAIMEARQIRGRILLKQNKVEEAIAEFKEALNIDPDYESAIFSLAEAYKKAKKYDEAIAGFKRLMQMDARDSKPPFNLGDIYLELKDIDKAIPYLQKSIQIDPEHSAMAHNLLGAAYIEKKNLTQAEHEINEALKIRPRIPDAYHNLALIFEAKGEFTKAIEQYKKEIELHPAAYPTHFNLALLYRNMGMKEEQVAHLEEAIKYKKDFAKGYLFLAKAYLDLNKNLPEAIDFAKEGLTLEPESQYSPLGHYILADIYNRLGRTNEANREFQKGRSLEEKLKKSSQ